MRPSGSPGDESQYRLLVDAISDYAIYMLDPEGRVSSWNPGAQRFKGYSAHEIIGQHFSRFYTDEDRAAGLPARALLTAATEGRFENEGWRVRKDGTRFWAHVIIDPIRGDEDDMVGFAKITRDVTERRAAQLALDEAREALFQSQKMDAIGQLTGGVAHDFNNLLMVVLGSLELLRKRMPPEPKLSALVDNAIQGAQRGAALTQRMLAFARKQELKLEPVDAPEIMRNMVALLQRSLGPGIRIEQRFAPSLPPVLADANQLEVALLNLAINGRDAMGEYGVITLSGEPRTLTARMAGLAPGDYVVLSVADTGEGMDEATLAKATEPFFTTKGVGKGTGLGLPMVHGVAAQSGGTLMLKSRLGEGSTAELWLPVATGAASAGETLPGPAPQARTLSLRVLAVDDDGLVLANTVSMLEDLGHQVIRVSSGEEALAVLRGGQPVDLMITDQAMPGMTGLQLIEVARSERPDLRALIATGYAELPEGTDPALPRLAKPFLQKDLALAIARAAPQPAPIAAH